MIERAGSPRGRRLGRECIRSHPAGDPPERLRASHAARAPWTARSPSHVFFPILALAEAWCGGSVETRQLARGLGAARGARRCPSRNPARSRSRDLTPARGVRALAPRRTRPRHPARRPRSSRSTPPEAPAEESGGPGWPRNASGFPPDCPPVRKRETAADPVPRLTSNPPPTLTLTPHSPNHPGCLEGGPQGPRPRRQGGQDEGQGRQSREAFAGVG